MAKQLLNTVRKVQSSKDTEMSWEIMSQQRYKSVQIFTLKSFVDPELAPFKTLGSVLTDLVHHGQVLDRLNAGVDDLADLPDLGPEKDVLG